MKAKEMPADSHFLGMLESETDTLNSILDGGTSQTESDLSENQEDFSFDGDQDYDYDSQIVNVVTSKP